MDVDSRTKKEKDKRKRIREQLVKQPSGELSARQKKERREARRRERDQGHRTGGG